MQGIVRRMFEATVKRLGVEFDSCLPRDVLEDLAGMSPRECKVRCEAAIAYAMSNGRREIDGGTWSLTRTTPTMPRSKMGFT